MSRSPFDDLPAVMTDGHPDGVDVSPPAGPGRHTRGIAAARATAVRSPQELDYRLRGLSLDPTGYVPAAPTRPERQRRRPRRRGPLLAKAVILVTVAALTAWLLQALAVQPFSVPGAAMAPTLEPGDRILVVKSGLLAGPVHRGEIVVLRPPRFLPCTAGGGGGNLVLRVIALPGQTIWSIDSTVFVDGRPLHERGWYDRRSGQVGSRPIPSTTLARDQYYVLGDQRSGACDSRVFGPISKSSIVGGAIAIVSRQSHVFLRKL
jgi:signal peptidase I